ncbi:two-component system sensor histidine kinase DctS [Sinorhizobium kostiense]|uniref:histidine kinase n=1 Tax=Sinorhizobium kostiense TaxID=76747 RepID=A0ABS4QW78_9HYPH|nr:PAS domain S-box protein [Sinorhizobium kostiense]MBP2234893.1 two-component system sensor histidine kinase DctS [Sinorhizobium kostiense]
MGFHNREVRPAEFEEAVRRSRGGTLKEREGTASGEDPWSTDIKEQGRRTDLLSLVPLAAIVALVALVAALVWIVSRSEAEQARTKLATDALWVEQTLRFQLSVDEDMLVRLALDASGGTPADVLDARARIHIANNPEVLSIVWHDATGDVLRAVPGLDSPPDQRLVDRMVHSRAVSARPVFSAVGAQRFTMGVLLQGGAGIVTATISVPLMLERHIPWWIAEQYSVELADAGGSVIARRAKRTPDPQNPTHTISFDPPLPGTVLRIASYEPPAAFVNTLLVAVIAGLAIFAILALLTLYRSAQRRRRAEERLEGEMAFRRSMEESLTVGLRAKDHAGRVLYVNSAFCNLVGWPAAELVGRTPPMPYWSPERLEETLARQRALTEGGSVSQSFETRFRRADGSQIDVQVYEAPLIDANGRHRGWMGSIIDITDTKRAARLARAQDESMARTGRLVTLGEMASTLAHELNQPLSAIASYAAGLANLLQRGKADPSVLGPAVEKLSVQANRAGQIIRRIQDFVKKREPRFGRLSLRDVVTGTIGFLLADARENRVRIVPELTDVGDVMADRILLEQVLVNLIRNGMEAMADGRRTGDRLTVRLLKSSDGNAFIEIEDQGAGIAPEVAGRLFDAFTSTKEQGMGMGLNICRSIVELHRGHLAHRAGATGGTVFTVTLPLADDMQEAVGYR